VSFIAPYQLKGRQTLNLIGEQSRATASSGLQIMPFSPQAQPSTWGGMPGTSMRSEEHTSELQSQSNLVCRLLLEKKKNNTSDRNLKFNPYKNDPLYNHITKHQHIHHNH